MDGPSFRPQVVWDAEVAAYLEGAFGKERLGAMNEALCKPPANTCVRVNTIQGSVQDVLSHVQQSAASLHQTLAGQQGLETAATTDQGACQRPEPAAATSHQPAEACLKTQQDMATADTELPYVHPAVPMAVIMPGEGPLPVDYSLAGGHEIIISRKAGEAVLRGAPVYAPGVVACTKGMQPGQLVAVTVALEQPGRKGCGITRGTTIPLNTPSQQQAQQQQQDPTCTGSSQADQEAEHQQQDPQRCAQQGRHAGDKPTTACQQQQQQQQQQQEEDPGGAAVTGKRSRGKQQHVVHKRQVLPDRSNLHIGLGRCMMSRSELFRVESGVAVVMEQPLFRVPSATGLEGRAMLQNLPSVVAAMALSPAPGSKVLDMCAAPGGKTTLLAQLMDNEGEIIALDRTHAKARQIMHLAQELGVTCIKAYKMDATKALLQPASTQSGEHQTPPEQPAQRVETSEADHEGKGDCMKASEGGPEQGGAVVAAAATATTEAKLVTEEVKKQRSDKAAARAARKQAARAARGLDPVKGPKPSPLAPMPPVSTNTAAAGNGQNASCDAQAIQPPKMNAAAQGGNAKDTELALNSSSCKDAEQHMQFDDAGMQDEDGMQVEDEAAEDVSGGGVAGALPAAPAGWPAESFDAILLDAPCSALGLRPRLLQTATLKYLVQCGSYTRKLLDVAVRLLKPGGKMVFSTCTISPRESEVNVRYVLDRYNGSMRLVPAVPRVGNPGLVGQHAGLSTTCKDTESAAAVAGEQYLSAEEASMVQRFDPAGSQDTIGFFVAAFIKTDSIV